jgi:hypothetical protein
MLTFEPKTIVKEKRDHGIQMMYVGQVSMILECSSTRQEQCACGCQMQNLFEISMSQEALDRRPDMPGDLQQQNKMS